MKYTFSTPNHERCQHVGLDTHITVEASNEEEAREKAMLERWGAPKFGLWRWTGQGLIRGNRSR